MRRIIPLLFLYVSCLANALGQPENDLCTMATPIPMGTPATCPNDSTYSFTLSGTTIEATPTAPGVRLSDPLQGIALNASLDDVWYQFTAITNTLHISIEGALEQPSVVLFQGEACSASLPVAIGQGDAGSQSMLLRARTEPGQKYFLLIGSGDFGGQGDFELTLEAQNDCSTCGERRGQLTASPAPANGTYEPGQEVTFCYTPTQWDPGFSLEWLHGVAVDFGDGWDLSTLTTEAPAACTAPDGEWAWYEEWESCSTGASFGPGFAFDGRRGLLCPNSTPFDGNPGNNFGDGPCDGIEPAPLDLEFCWTLQVQESFASAEAANLNLDIRLLGDGYSGSWMMYSCEPERTSRFFATAAPPVSAQPAVSVVQAACPALCNGKISLFGGSGAQFALLDTAGAEVFTAPGPAVNTIVEGLCPGAYTFVIEEGGTAQSIGVEVPAADLPDVTASYVPTCLQGDTYQLLANVAGSNTGMSYNWSGPNGFTANAPNPETLDPGVYTLNTAQNNCPLPPVELTVESVLPSLSCAAATESSVTFEWAALPTDTAFSVEVLSGQSGQMTGPHQYQVTGLSPGESVSIQLVAQGIGLCPAKVTEQTCAAASCPQPDAGPDTLLCDSGGLPLSIDAEPNAAIAWSPAAGLSCTDCTDPVAAPDETTTYQVAVTNSAGCIGIDLVTIYVDELPGDAFPDEPATFCPGVPFTYCLPEGNRYLWISPIGFIRTGECLKFPYTSAGIAGTYTVQVRLPDGCKVTEELVLEVGEDCPDFIAPGLGGNAIQALQRWEVFPNPATNQTTVRTAMDGPKTLSLYQANGQLAGQWPMEGPEIQLDLSSLSRGPYFLELSGRAGAEQLLLSVQ